MLVSLVDSLFSLLVGIRGEQVNTAVNYDAVPNGQVSVVLNCSS